MLNVAYCIRLIEHYGGCPRRCRECDRVFFEKTLRSKICSEECRQARGWTPVPKNDFICLQCGKAFVGIAGRKFCSRRCDHKYRWSHEKVPPRPWRNVICKSCNTKFLGRGHMQFCSDVCRKLRQKQNLKKRYWRQKTAYLALMNIKEKYNVDVC